MKKISTYMCGLALSLAVVSQAHALDKGQSSIKYEAEVASNNGKKDWDHKVKVAHGVTSRFDVAVEGRIRDRNGQENEYDRTKLELTYLMTRPEHYMQAAIEGAYGYNHSGSSDQVSTTLKLKKQYNNWEHKIEPELYLEVGEDSQDGLGAVLEMVTAYSFPSFSVGYEYNGDFGKFADELDYSEQEHLIGPTVGFSFPVIGQKIGIDLTYMAGISRAADDHVFKYEMSTKF
jgi:hypothetical protein